MTGLIRLSDEDLGIADEQDHILYIQYLIDQAETSGNWRAWLNGIAPDFCPAPFAAHHARFWEWVWSIKKGVKPRPFVGIWPRGGAKSTSAELAVVTLAALRRRTYALYVSATQELADDHVASIGSLFEDSRVLEICYPDLAERMVGKFGSSKGWRRNRLRTASGFTLDAVGLDTAARGIKINDQRPNMMIFDDLDAEGDGPTATRKKLDSLSRKLLPAGSSDLAVLAIQNMIIPNGIFAQLADGTAEILTDRLLSGPVPAVVDAVIEQDTESNKWMIVSGQPTWEGQNLETCQNQINEWGVTAFRIEAQHEVTDPPGGMYNHLAFEHIEPDKVPDLVRTVVWVDPAVTDHDRSDSMAVQCDGMDSNGVIYRIESWEERSSPENALRTAIRMALRHHATTLGVETDQGGNTWFSVYREACRSVSVEDNIPLRSMPTFAQDKAGSGHGSKVHRNSQMLADYERPGRIIHVLGPSTSVLEKALHRFPVTKPFDLADACYWSWYDLRKSGRNKLHSPVDVDKTRTTGSLRMTRRRLSGPPGRINVGA